MKLATLLLLLSVLAYTASAASVVPSLYPYNSGGVVDIDPAQLEFASSEVYNQRLDNHGVDYYPNWSPLDPVGGPTYVTVKGCGFRTFSEVVCVFDWQFTSELSWIEDDSTVICQLPRFARTDFMTVPYDSRLDIVFDGNPEKTTFVGPFRWGPQVDCETPISPERGYTSGNYQVTLYGQGFNDLALPNSILDVWFDNERASGCSASSDGTMITCSSIPSVDEIHRDALVSITWGAGETRFTYADNVESFLHATTLFHYGPYVSGVSACTSFGGMAYVSGGSAGVDTNGNGFGTVTIEGEGFNDPIFDLVPRAPDSPASSMPASEFMVEITFSQFPPNNDEYTSKQIVRQVFPSAITDTSITFTAPDFSEFTSDTAATLFNNIMGNSRGTATAVVYYRQHAGQQSVSTPQREAVASVSYKYGPIVTGVGKRASTATTAADRQWHQGGETEICVHGCGFNSFNTDELDIVGDLSGTSICTGAVSIVSDNVVCCAFAPHSCTQEARNFDVHLEILPNSGANMYLPGTIETWNVAIVGPILASTNNAVGADEFFHAYVDADSWPGRSISGTNLRFTSGSGSTGATGGWSSVTVGGGGSACAGNTVSISSDAGLVVTYSDEDCDIGDVGDYTITFTPVDSTGNCVLNYRDNFGPSCVQRTSHSRVQGGDSISVTGYGFNRYSPRIVLCDADEDATCDTQLDLDDDDLNVGSTSISGSTSTDTYTMTATTTAYLTDTGNDGAATPRFRGRRFWGQWFDVKVAVNSFADGNFGGNDFEFDSCADPPTAGRCTSSVVLSCGSHRFGPVTSAISPCSGGIDGGTAVAVTSTSVSDTWYDKNGAGDINNGDSPHLTAFGSLVGEWDTGRSGTSVNTVTRPERHEVIDYSDSGLVSVLNVFDACNMTAPVTNGEDEVTIYWGPRFVSMAKDTKSAFDTDGQNTYMDAAGDFWGAHPEARQTFRVLVYGMAEWCSDGSECDDNYVRVLVDGVLGPALRVETGDLHANDDSATVLTFELPQRPYGTTASVCLMFTDLESDLEGPDDYVFDPDTDVDQDIDWSRVICADEKVHYEVKGLGITGGKQQLTSGGDEVTVAFLGLDTANWDVENVYLGGFPFSGTASTNEVSFTPDSDIAEFNTGFSVRVQWTIPESYYTDDDGLMRGCEYPGHYDNHWISWSTEEVWFGPTCSVTGDVSLYGQASRPGSSTNPTDRITVTSSTGLQDCPNENSDLCSQGYPDDEDDRLCNIPIFGGRAQYPFSSDASDTEGARGRGNKFCYHRYIRAYYAFFNNAASAGSVPEITNPSPTATNAIHVDDDQINGSGAYQIQLPRQTSCGKLAVALYFPDVLVSTEAQRWVQCSGEVHYGPRVTAFASVWRNDADDTAYGYGYSTAYNDGNYVAGTLAQTGTRRSKYDDHLYTILGSNWNDASLNDRSFVPRISGTGWSSPVHTAYTPGPSVNSIAIGVPSKTGFGAEVTGITLSWDTACVFNTGWKFHYGPVIYGGSRDRCTEPETHPTPVRLDQTNAQVTITGRALECCGFEDLSSGTTYAVNTGTTNCLFRSGDYENDQWERDGFSYEDDGLLKNNMMVTCEVPANDIPSRRLYNFGLAFGADYNCDDDGTAGKCTPVVNTDFALALRRCEDGHSMDICYGPKMSPTTHFVRMSGFQDGSCSDDPDVDGNGFVNDAHQIVFAGDDFSGDSEVDNDNGSCTFIINGVTITSPMFAANTCKVPIWYKECGQEMIDTVYITHDVVSGDYTEREFTYPDVSDTVWQNEGTVIVNSKIHFGPIATYAGADSNVIEVSNKEVRVYTDNGSQDITITTTKLRDWSCVDNMDRYALQYNGGFRTMALFGNRRSVDSANEYEVRNGHFPTFNAGDDEATLSYTVPSGNFGESGKIRIIIDPHFDEYTVLDDEGDTERGFDDDDDYRWHWVPAVTGLSRTWSVPGGMETVTVYGWGFSSAGFYSRAVCYFGAEEGMQADILTNTMVVCQVPKDHAPGTASVSVFLNDDDCDNVFEDCGVIGVIGDTVTAPTQFTFVGVTDAWPLHGPIHGNTPVQIEAVGLENYVSVHCVWHLAGGDETYDIQEGNVCVSPSTDQEGLVRLTLEGTWWGVDGSEQVWSDELGCFWFDFGYPSIESVSPSSVHVAPVNDVDTVVTVSGRYFNGGLLDATQNGTGFYDCLWAVGVDTTTDLPREIGSSANWDRVLRTSGVRVATVNNDFGKAIDSFDIVCPLPTGFGLYGSYPFEIEFSDGSRTRDNFDFDVMVSDILSLDGWESDPDWFSPMLDGNYVDELELGMITLSGAGFFGGRVGNSRHTSSYLVRFGIDERFMTPQDYIYALAEVVDDNSLVVAKLTRSLENNTSEEPFSNIPVAVSVDGGYTFSAEIEIPYRKNDELRECFENSASALSFSVLFVFAIAGLLAFF